MNDTVKQMQKEELETLVTRFCLADDGETVQSDNQEWKIERGNSFIIAQIFHFDTPVCNIISPPGFPELHFEHLDEDYLFVAQSACTAIKRCYKNIRCTITNENELSNDNDKLNDELDLTAEQSKGR